MLGIEPAANIAELAIKTKGIPTLVEFFDEELAERLAAEGKLADVIHAHNVFAHVPDPNRFAGGIKRLLKPHGVAVVEAPYVRDLIDKLEFDTIYHEHFSYYSVSAVEALCRRHGLVVCDVELVPIHGGSLRLFIAHAGQPPSARVVELLAKEKSEGLLTFEHYRDFGDRVARLKAAAAGAAAAAARRRAPHCRLWRIRQGKHLDECVRHRRAADRVRGRPLEPQAGPLHAGQPPADSAAGSSCSSASRTTFYC